MADINLTLFHPPSSKTDAISLPPSTTLADLSNFASAILGLDDNGGGIVISKDSFGSPLPLLFSPDNAATNGPKTLGQCGIANGDLLSVLTKSEYDQLRSSGSPVRQRQRTAPPASAAPPAAAAGGLDFSSLLGSVAAQPPVAAVAPSNNNNTNNTGGGLTFNIPGLLAASNANNTTTTITRAPPIQWDGMHLDDAIERNPDPYNLMTILTNTTRHPNLLKELNYHNPTMYKKLMSVPNNNLHQMATLWRETMLKSTTARFLQRHSQQSIENDMRQRLERNPMDELANRYFGEKIQKENVQRQYEQMMEEYPESMGRVLMLYMNCMVNDKSLQVFVDSGAESTIMSSECADRLGLLHLVDTRFQGVAVGVGTGKILGRIHIVELTIGGYAFPCSITVMDSESGLGDKNMDCLFGLDMLKRHRCSIDLAKNALVFPLGMTGQVMEAPFLHEKDLPRNKGGTMGFDAEKENAELEARWEKMETEEEEKGAGKEVKKEGGDDDENGGGKEANK